MIQNIICLYISNGIVVLIDDLGPMFGGDLIFVGDSAFLGEV